MKEIVDRDEPIAREVWDRDEAIAHFKSIGEHYKAEIIEGLPAGEDDHGLSPGRSGRTSAAGRTCRRRRQVGKAFKLTKLAGAYWRGDHRNAACCSASTARPGPARPTSRPTSSASRKPRSATTASSAGPWTSSTCRKRARGMVFWHPKGWTLYRTLEAYMRRRLDAAGYVEVQDAAGARPRASGSSPATGRSIGPTCSSARRRRARSWPLKPMNCPGHVQIFNARPEVLPRPAAAHGRVRRLPPLRAVGRAARPDAGARLHAGRRPHLLPRGPDRGGDGAVHRAAAKSIYARLRPGAALASSWPLRPELRAGTDEFWDMAEAQMLERGRASGRRRAGDRRGEGAFYGAQAGLPPARTPSAATWQCGTLQLDYVLPERLDAEYVGRGRRQAPAGDAAPGDPAARWSASSAS